MTKGLTRPNWYQEEFYNKNRTPEEWLYELIKRDRFNRNDIGYSHSIHSLPIKEQEKLFIEILFDEQIREFLHRIEATPPQPIRWPSVSDIFIMYHQIINTDWYKNHPSRDAFESAISAIANEGVLSSDQKIAFWEMYKTPWCASNENHQQDNWCPKKENAYLTGIPISLDPYYLKADIIKILKKKLNAWIGKIQEIQLQFASWQESKILAVFDLRLWLRIQRIEYTNIGLHKLIWPNGRISKSTGLEVNPYDDIDHSINLANRVITHSVTSSLYMLCKDRKFEMETSGI